MGKLCDVHQSKLAFWEQKRDDPYHIAHPYLEVQSEPVFSGLSRSEKDLELNPLVPKDHSRTPLLKYNVDFRAKTCTSNVSTVYCLDTSAILVWASAKFGELTSLCNVEMIPYFSICKCDVQLLTMQGSERPLLLCLKFMIWFKCLYFCRVQRDNKLEYL